MFTNTAGTTAVTADGQTIAAWRDKSINTYLFTQATTGNQPSYKVGIQNGFSVTRWNGTSTGLQSSTTLPFYTSASSGGSFFVVFLTTNNSSQRFLMTYQNQVYNTYCQTESELGYTTGNVTQGNFGFHRGCSYATVAYGQITTNQYYLMSYILGSSGTTPANSTIFKNGNSVTIQNDNLGFYSAGSYPNGNNARYLNIGYRVPYGTNSIDCWHSGDIAELIWYQNPLTTTQQQQVESYLAAKWGLTSSLPTSHLHATQPAGKPVAATQLFLKALPINIDATGGDTVVTANGYRTHTFTTVGSAANFVINSNPINTPLQVLVVAGGGGGGGDRAAGGGGGGLIFLSSTTVAVGTYNITVGAGGIPGWWGPSGGNGRVAGNGGNSVFNGNTAIGGGGAGQHQYWLNGSYQNYGEPYYGVGRAGGSGGGGSAPGPSYPTAVGGAPTSGQGYAGGSGYYNGSICCCGGGGGAGGVGGNGLSAAGGAGGPGLQITIGGSSAYYAGGGGGAAAQDYRAAVGGAGGVGGGGQADQSASVSGTAGTNGLGGGGGGAGNGSGWAGSSGLGGNVAGFAGGSGTVIIAYQYS